MRKFGSTLVLLGVLAIVLNFVNMVPSFLFWIYSWGEATAWGIKIGIVVLGAILYFLGNDNSEEDE